MKASLVMLLEVRNNIDVALHPGPSFLLGLGVCGLGQRVPLILSLDKGLDLES